MASFLFITAPVFASTTAQDQGVLPQAQVLALAESRQLSEHAVWGSMLHLRQGEPQVKDQGFLLSWPNFSKANELKATIAALYQDKKTLCRYPARRRFIIEQLELSNNALPSIDQCAELNEYRQRAPLDEMTLVYTSENLSQPQSMMGHIMLKMSGVAASGHKVEHGVSFFTEIDGINVPKMIWDTLIVGKQGFFQVAPFREALQYYLLVEQRNVWQYQLALSDAQKKLIHDHIWELRSANLRYFFDQYNCATVTQLIMAIAYPELRDKLSSLVTPIDVVKSAEAVGMIEQTQVMPSSKWKIRLLRELLKRNQIEQSSRFVKGQQSALQLDGLPEQTQYLTLQMAQAYNQYLYHQDELSEDKWRDNHQRLNVLNDGLSQDYQINLNDYKSPLKTPKDSQWNIGWVNRNNDNWLRLSLLPTSHRLEDDNRQFFSENELALSSLSVLYQPDENLFKLEQWMIYAVRSQVPWNEQTGGLSGQLRFGFEQQLDETLDWSLAFHTKGGLGYTYSLSPDLHVFANANAGISLWDSAEAYVEPEVGFYFYQIFDMKSLVSFSSTHFVGKARSALNKFSFKQSIYRFKDINLVLDYQRKWNDGFDLKQYGIQLSLLF